jgi:hypothetical protein
MAKVRVRLVDEEGTLLGEAELEPEALPESFEAETTLELGGESWRVMRAQPMTRAAYVATGELTLALRKRQVQMVNPNDILFSLPTINDFVPGVAAGSSKLDLRMLELHQDLWRQVELVSRGHSAVVAAELAKVRRILERRQGPGYKEIHVRKQPAAPLSDTNVTLAELERLWPEAEHYDGVSFEGVAGLIEHGFALDAGTLQLYGQAEDGVVTTLALARAIAEPPPQLRQLMRVHALLLVEWCTARVVE